MSLTTNESGLSATLSEALLAFTGCIGEALVDICSYGLTIGETYVPFDPDPEDGCEDDEVACSQAWVRVMGVQAEHQGDSFGGECAGLLRIDIEVGVLRCIAVPEGGEAPAASDVLRGSLKALNDMNTMYCSAMNCEVWDSIESGQWTPLGPTGGQFGGIWTFTVESTGSAVPGGVEQTGLGVWTGHGPPVQEDIPYAKEGDEYIDLDSGNVYEISF